MKKLSKTQIQFIEDYLIKNKVKYWDLRMELLDHIVNAIEEKISNGENFDDALMEIHKSFGNKESSKKLNKDNTQWIINKSIYADNSGYTKLIQEKRIELNKGFFKSQGQLLFGYLKKPSFMLLFALVLIFLILSEKLQFDGKLFFLIGFVPLILVALIPGIFWLIHYKKTKSSLFLSGLSSIPFRSMSLLNILLFLPNAINIVTEDPLPLWYLLLVFAILLPIVVSEVDLYVTQFKKYNKIHNKYA